MKPTRPGFVLVVLCAGVFMASLDLFIVNVAFPDIARDFGGASLSSLSWVLNAYAIVYAALLVPAGRWADAMGRRRGFLLGLAIFTLASALCAVAPGTGWLVAARVLQAAGGALMTPTSLGLLLPAFPPERRHVALGVWAATSGVAAAAGPPIGGLLVELSWRWVFLVNVPIGLAALVAGARILPEIREQDAARPDLAGAALLATGVGALVVAIVKGSDWGWASTPVVALLAASVVLLVALARRCAWHPAPVIEPAIVRVRAFTVVCTSMGLFFAAFGAMLLGAVLFLTTVWHESVLTAGLMLAPGPATAALFSVPGARLSARIGPSATGALGAALFALGGLWWVVRMGADPAYASTFLPGFMIGGAGVGLVNPSLTGAAAAAVPPTRFATGAGLLTMGRQIGTAIGVAVLVAVLGATPDVETFRAGASLVVGFAVLAAALLLTLGSARAPRVVPAPA